MVNEMLIIIRDLQLVYATSTSFDNSFSGNQHASSFYVCCDDDDHLQEACEDEQEVEAGPEEIVEGI